MKYQRPINWNEVPDIITKEQFYRICHISKSTALYLLKSGTVPCEYSGKKTRCYKIKKADVQKYLESKGKFPEYYSAPKGWYKGNNKITLPVEMLEEALKLLHDYYADLLSDYKDVITSQEVVKLTGYAKSTITNWCGKGRLKHFIKHNTYYIPKVFLIEFFCSPYFRSIIRKTSWHIQTINEFHHLMQKERSKRKLLSTYLRAGAFSMCDFKICTIALRKAFCYTIAVRRCKQWHDLLKSFITATSIRRHAVPNRTKQ